jgi:hypothetical protein
VPEGVVAGPRQPGGQERQDGSCGDGSGHGVQELDRLCPPVDQEDPRERGGQLEQAGRYVGQGAERADRCREGRLAGQAAPKACGDGPGPTSYAIN